MCNLVIVGKAVICKVTFFSFKYGGAGKLNAIYFLVFSFASYDLTIINMQINNCLNTSLQCI